MPTLPSAAHICSIVTTHSGLAGHLTEPEPSHSQPLHPQSGTQRLLDPHKQHALTLHARRIKQVDEPETRL